LPSHGDQFGFAQRNSPEGGVFRSVASLQVVQASLWPKPGQLATRTRDSEMSLTRRGYEATGPYAKANPGKINMTSPAPKSSLAFSELFKSMAGMA
jgi:hypothetical protein